MKYINKPNIKIVQNWLDNAKDYNDDDNVRNYLRWIHKGCCAYCECSPEAGSYFNVEHFYDKGTFVDKPSKEHPLRKDIRNLHYSCERCNKLKMNDKVDNIFSPNYYLKDSDGACVDWDVYGPEKIASSFFYEGPYIYSSSKDLKAEETIKMFDLNAKREKGRKSRASLVYDRKRVLTFAANRLKDIWILIAGIKEDCLDKPIAKEEASPIISLIEQLKDMMSDSEPYSTMVIDNYGESLFQLIELLKHRLSLPQS